MSLTGHMELGARGRMPGPSSGFTNRETEAQRELRRGHSHTTHHWWQSWARARSAAAFQVGEPVAARGRISALSGPLFLI